MWQHLMIFKNIRLENDCSYMCLYYLIVIKNSRLENDCFYYKLQTTDYGTLIITFGVRMYEQKKRAKTNNKKMVKISINFGYIY